MSTQALIDLPQHMKLGDVITLRCLVQHAMETGYRRSAEGELLPQNLIRRFECVFESGGGDRVLVFDAQLHAAIAANPSLTFHWRVSGAGRLRFRWTGDNGFVHEEVRAVVLA